MKRLYILAVVALLCSCNDDFLEKYPKGDPTAETAFVNYGNFKAYAWGLYETLPWLGYGSENATDDISNNGNNARGTSESNWIRGNVVVPDARGGTDWDYYSFIRRVNLMLDHIDGSAMNDTEKANWRSVGYFFRSFRYFSLLSSYGGVPWIDHVLGDDETDLIKGPRATRDEIAQHILTDLQYAETHINPNGEGANTINKATVQALLSRFTLFEGTWRKYHGLSDAETYLRECKRVSAELIASFPNIAPCYDDLFCSLDLSGVPGVILYRAFSNDAQVTHAVSIGGTVNPAPYQPTRDFVDSYLCCDGRTRWDSPKFLGDKDMYDEFSNRDHRMWMHITPPYRVYKTTSGGWDPDWKFTENPKDRSFFDSLANIGLGYGSAKERQKLLPFRQGYSGGILGCMPHPTFFRKTEVQNAAGQMSWCNQPWYAQDLGYGNWKYYCCYLDMGSQRNEETDMPVFRIGETMLNYAEVMCELGEFTQDVADQTINKLRSRANVAPMRVADITASFDPTRDKGDARYQGDYEVSPLLWEVRRERRIELFSEGFRFNDLRRWKKCHYAMKKKLGRWIRKSDYADPGMQVNMSTIYIDGGGDEGYLEYHPEQTHLWPEYYYLYAIPRNERVLNPNLEQNPGWDDGIAN